MSSTVTAATDRPGLGSDYKPSAAVCAHCGQPCPAKPVRKEELAFCCHGCASVYALLQEANLCTFYDQNPAQRPPSADEARLRARFEYLADEALVRPLAHFYRPEAASITLYIPAMQCAACLYLLERLPMLNPAVRQARVDFVRKELTLDWIPAQTNLQDLAVLLARLGYEPVLQTAGTERPAAQKKYLQGLVARIGVAGFCAGNLMLFSFPEYLGIEDAAPFVPLFTVLKVVLALPVFFYCASDYLQGAYRALLRKEASLDVALALGITILFVRSLVDIGLGQGPGYLDSLAGLVLFLLVGKWVQARSFDHLRFEQTLDAYFPLAAKVIEGQSHRYQKADTLQPGQTIEVLSEMLVPADGTLLQGPALLDYSFATGESKPVLVHTGEAVFAGGRLLGAAIRLTVDRPMTRSRFTTLWSHAAFERKPADGLVARIEHLFTRYFTTFVLTLAGLTAASWAWLDPSQVWPATTAVLLVACPCALSLAMPFATHAAMQRLARHGMFVRQPQTLQELAGLQKLVFDKTGTLTQTEDSHLTWQGQALTAQDAAVVAWMVGQSAHPLAQALQRHLGPPRVPIRPYGFEDKPGRGLQAIWGGDTYRLGSLAFATDQPEREAAGSQVAISRNGMLLGVFSFGQQLRLGVAEMLHSLGRQGYGLALLSGDAEGQASLLAPHMAGGEVVMGASPLQKLEFVQDQVAAGYRTAMIGDGMNDAGAFAAAHLGIAVREHLHHFTPSCDVILEADRLAHLPAYLAFCRRVLRGVGWAFALSLVFNALALTLAVRGELSPAVAALLMPSSSMLVVLASLGLVKRAGNRLDNALAVAS